MSSFNETIKMTDSFQCGMGSVGNATAEKLDSVRDAKIHKELVIKNTHATNKLYVGKANVSSSFGLELGANEQVELQIDNPANVYVIGSALSTTYTWLAY